MGFDETNNFLHHTNNREAYYRCYYTGKLELPTSYEELRFKEGTQAGCNIDEDKYDVFFYPMEAVATGRTPVTSSLAEASLERLVVVVPHEDFHGNDQISALPTAVTEAAATLIGFLTAAEFAQRHFGETSPTYQNLSGEAELFLRKAEIVNAYHAELGRLYASRRRGDLTRQTALARKRETLARMREECKSITPNPSSFNECPAVMNNAGLAFDATYTRHYPLFHRLVVAQGYDLETAVKTLKSLPPKKSLSEHEIVQHFQDPIVERRASEPH